MSDELVPVPIVPKVITIDSYGEYIRRSTLCDICRHRDHVEINLLRARDHLSIQEIADRINAQEELVEKHFKYHYKISRANRQIIKLSESPVTQANELVEKIMDGDIDIFSAAEGVLASKGKRLDVIFGRLEDLSDEMEADRGLPEFETGEFIQFNKLATEIENDILDTYKVINKHVFPYKKEELKNAVLSYKLNILTKMMEQIQLTLFEFERRPEFADLIKEFRSVLAHRINKLEDEILKSGGIMRNTTETDET